MATIGVRWFVLAALSAAIAAGPSAVAGTFPGRNGVLVFDAVDQTTRTVQIFQVSASGAGLRRLTTTTGDVWNEDPTVFANGRSIYFDSLDRATTRPSHIYRMNANGTGRKLADGASAPTHVWPSIDRSGSALAVVQYGDGGEFYSPDGTKIAYLQCTGDCGDPELRGQGSIWIRPPKWATASRI
jgi:Tol biopolymer transport system component